MAEGLVTECTVVLDDGSELVLDMVSSFDGETFFALAGETPVIVTLPPMTKPDARSCTPFQLHPRERGGRVLECSISFSSC